MKKAKQFTPKTIEVLQLKGVNGGGIGGTDNPYFLGQLQPIDFGIGEQIH
ncbi:hypothetical protein L1285_13070 [Pseudoalteromonas sp. DL2-H2.2]|nr:hypothetical protein [Pseudoalteromonas sp. DL2-H2.2]MCF2909253.1 hypothetical protein [Pseudoalteromonas sp. DL2-H2.2]